MASIHSPHKHLTMSAPPTAAASELKFYTVNRSNELLSCARTALKISQAKLRQRDSQKPATSDLPEWLLEIDPASLKLHVAPSKSLDPFGAPLHSDDTPSQILLKDSSDLLAMLDGQLSELHSLVRRRGHTNDPTLEIQSTLEKFHEGVKEMKEVCATLAQEGNQPIETARGNRISLQRRKHYELLSGHLESLAKERMDALKMELEMRSVVIRDQMSHRKKLLSAGASGASSTAVNRRVNVPLQKNLNVNSSAAQFQSPLFTMTASGNAPMSKTSLRYGGEAASAPSSYNGNGVAKSAYAGYGGYKGSSYGAYGGASLNETSFSTGMRQRKQQPVQQQSRTAIQQGDDDDKYTKDGTLQQIQTRRQNRQTASRLQSARLAEKSIAELTTMFSKMSNLISQQGEVLERIEDDVEAASGDIDAGHDELVKVYGYTKGNRGLIIKVFAVLIFLIVFMRFYKR